MRNYARLGPVAVRVSRKHLAKWGYPLVSVCGVNLLTWASDGAFQLVSYHPRWSLTWLFVLEVRKGALAKRVMRFGLGEGNTSTYRWLPFGFTLCVRRQKAMRRREAIAHG